MKKELFMLISLLVLVIFIAGCFTETPKTDKANIKITPSQEETSQAQENNQPDVIQDIEEYDVVEDTSDVDDLTSGFEGL